MRALALQAMGRVEEGLVAVRRPEQGGWPKLERLAAQARRLAALPRSELLPLWEQTLRLSATRSRCVLLEELEAFVPVIASLGGPGAIDEACRAIKDVGRWWP